MMCKLYRIFGIKFRLKIQAKGVFKSEEALCAIRELK